MNTLELSLSLIYISLGIITTYLVFFVYLIGFEPIIFYLGNSSYTILALDIKYNFNLTIIQFLIFLLKILKLKHIISI